MPKKSKTSSLHTSLKKRSLWQRPWVYLGLLLFITILFFVLLQVTPLRTTLLSPLIVRIQRWINPPAQNAFIPQQQDLVQTAAAATMQALLPIASPQPVPEQTSTPQSPAQQALPSPTSIPSLQASPAPPLPPVPDQAFIDGVVLEYQQFNNCGPVNLAMLLSFWGYPTTQKDTAPVLKSLDEDRNVGLDEMLTYLEEHTGLRAVIRYGGRMETVQQLVAAGFPVLIERGHTSPKDGWMGHYSLVTAYDNPGQFVRVPDSLLGNIHLDYAEFQRDWDQFAGIYLLAYPPEREVEALALLGPDADLAVNLENAARFYAAQASSSTGLDAFFETFALGTIYTLQEDYPAAAQTYDSAWALYAQLQPAQRPWRMLWYQFGPYESYYAMGRYADLRTLARQTLDDSYVDSLPETWYWAARAALAMQDLDAARFNLQKALDWWPDWPKALELRSAVH